MLLYAHGHVWLALAIPFAALISPQAATPSRLGRLPIWDDGLSEMSYYDAEMTIYGKPRKYTRIHMMNRQWFDTQRGVKSDKPESPAVVPVFKFHICEEIPTENYNYRFTTTVFLHRESLRPLKTVESSQEWCGTTYKHLRWKDNGLNYQSFSYFPGEGDDEWNLDGDVWPFEASFILARELVAAGAPPETKAMLPPLQSNRRTAPLGDAIARNVSFSRDAEPVKLSVPAGSFKTNLVTLTAGDTTYRYWIETDAPYRLIKFETDGIKFELRGVERRAYWDRNWKSRFHAQGQAP